MPWLAPFKVNQRQLWGRSVLYVVDSSDACLFCLLYILLFSGSPTLHSVAACMHMFWRFIYKLRHAMPFWVPSLAPCKGNHLWGRLVLNGASFWWFLHYFWTWCFRLCDFLFTCLLSLLYILFLPARTSGKPCPWESLGCPHWVLMRVLIGSGYF